jgi:hypothetical protein
MGYFNFLLDIVATVIGGVLLTALFFLVKEKVFPLPNLSGRWYLEQTTACTAHKPYAGMVLRYVVLLWRKGDRVEGTAEKIYERSSTGEREFVGKHRTRAAVSGYVEKAYLGADRIYLHVVEDGHGRESSHFYALTAVGSGTMEGAFTSMVADQEGSTKWQRAPFE